MRAIQSAGAESMFAIGHERHFDVHEAFGLL
jgi:hypothetical protein